MANKINVKLILELRNAGMGRDAIVASRHISKNSVGDVFHIDDRPDYEYVHQELKRTGVTLKLLWQEYQDRCRTSGGIPMGYTKYCQGYSNYTVVNKLTNHLEHKPGAAVEVDWFGPTMNYVDISTVSALFRGGLRIIPQCVIIITIMQVFYRAYQGNSENTFAH